MVVAAERVLEAEREVEVERAVAFEIVAEPDNGAVQEQVDRVMGWECAAYHLDDFLLQHPKVLQGCEPRSRYPLTASWFWNWI